MFPIVPCGTFHVDSTRGPICPSIHPSILFCSSDVCHGNRMSRIFQTPFSSVMFSSSSWRIPRPDETCDPLQWILGPWKPSATWDCLENFEKWKRPSRLLSQINRLDYQHQQAVVLCQLPPESLSTLPSRIPLVQPLTTFTLMVYFFNSFPNFSNIIISTFFYAQTQSPLCWHSIFLSLKQSTRTHKPPFLGQNWSSSHDGSFGGSYDSTANCPNQQQRPNRKEANKITSSANNGTLSPVFSKQMFFLPPATPQDESVWQRHPKYWFGTFFYIVALNFNMYFWY